MGGITSNGYVGPSVTGLEHGRHGAKVWSPPPWTEACPHIQIFRRAEYRPKKVTQSGGKSNWPFFGSTLPGRLRLISVAEGAGRAQSLSFGVGVSESDRPVEHQLLRGGVDIDGKVTCKQGGRRGKKKLTPWRILFSIGMMIFPRKGWWSNLTHLPFLGIRSIESKPGSGSSKWSRSVWFPFSGFNQAQEEKWFSQAVDFHA